MKTKRVFVVLGLSNGNQEILLELYDFKTSEENYYKEEKFY